MVADRARGQLDAVADDVVLDRLEAEELVVVVRDRARGIRRPPCSASRTGCGRSRSSSPPRSTRTSGNRRSSRIRSGPCRSRPSSLPILVRAGPANFTKSLGSPATKNTASPASKPSSHGIAWRALGGRGCLAIGPLPGRAAPSSLFAPEDVAEARLALALRPIVHAVAERRGCRRPAPESPRPRRFGSFDHAREHLEARAAEGLGDVLHLDRIAQVRLVGAILRASPRR